MSIAKTECVACRARIPSDTVLCEVCGAPQKDLPPCPHCRGKGAVTTDDELRLVCNLCGGPRVPYLPGDLESSGGEARTLKVAQAARKARGLWRALAAVGGFSLPFVAFFALFLGLVWSWTVAFGVFAVLGLPFAAMLGVGLRTGKAKTEQMTRALDRAWLSVAHDIADQRDGRLTARDLSKTLGIDRPQAEQMLAMLVVDDELKSGGTRLSVLPDARFEALEGQSDDAFIDEVEREAEAEAEAEAEKEAAKKRTRDRVAADSGDGGK